MKKIVLLILVLSFSYSCEQKKTSDKKEEVKPKIELKSVEKIIVDPDPDDGIPPERYSPNNSNIEVAAKIRKFLTDELLKDDLKIMTKDQRKFQYEEVDLNDDGKKEYLIGFKNSYFCGSGGCTFYLLHNDGTVITIFTVSDAPFIALESKTKGWRDLLVYSNGALRILKFDGKTYPANPSIATVFDVIPSDDAHRLLWNEFPIPTFKF